MDRRRKQLRNRLRIFIPIVLLLLWLLSPDGSWAIGMRHLSWSQFFTVITIWVLAAAITGFVCIHALHGLEKIRDQHATEKRAATREKISAE